MSSTMQPITITSPRTRAKELALNARKLLEELKALEIGMVMEENQQCTENSTSSTSRRGQSLPHSQSSPTPQHHRDQNSSSLPSRQPRVKSSSTTTVSEEPIDKKQQVTGAFTNFCEQLLCKNQVWKEEQRVRALKASIRALEKEKSSNAFKSFCDRLLVSNKIWQLERQIRDLVAEGERDRRTRAAAITHAAKQMAVDVRKEAMIEEFVVELVQELEESKRMVVEMKDEHEKEVREIHGDWLKEYRQLFWENEQLRLDHHSRLAEQEVSNELEQSLYDALEWSQRRIGELENGDLESTLVGDVSGRESVLFSGSEFSADETLLEDIDDGLSTISSSSTCVSSQKAPSWSTKSGIQVDCQRKAKLAKHTNPKESYRAAALRRQALRKLDVTPYAGFSFNPLFFGNGETLVVSPSRAVEAVEPPVKMSLKHVSSSKTSHRERKDSTTVRTSRSIGPTGSRAPWRV